MLSTPDVRVQLEEDLKKKIRERRMMSPPPQPRCNSPPALESPDSNNNAIATATWESLACCVGSESPQSPSREFLALPPKC
jgi:hypothetical protein